jgi:hypothetical protein
MTRQCAWCKTILGETSLGNGDEVTHGICPACSALVLRQAGGSAASVRASESQRGEPHRDPVR